MLLAPEKIGRILRWCRPRLAASALALALASPGHAQNETTKHVNVRVGNVLVLANANRSDSLEIAAEYCRARNLPAVNLLRLDVNSAISIGGSEYNSQIQAPVDQRLRELGPAVDYIVITRGVPYRVNKQSVTAALTFGGLGNMLPEQPFFGQQRPFDGALPCHGVFMKPTTALITYSVQDALDLMERSLVIYPSPERAGTFYFCDGKGPRGIRNRHIPMAIARLHALRANATHDMEPSLANRLDIMAQFTGIPSVKMTGNTYLPGSLLDNVTSWGGYLLDGRGHTTLTEMVRHGVCGAYGTVVEPTNNPTRWPTFTLPEHYARGFNLADSYLASVRDIRLGVVVGDPLAAPFSHPPQVDVQWTAAPDTALDAEGTVEFIVKSSDDQGGIASVDLWVDDRHRVAVFSPEIPAGSVIRLQLNSRGREIASKRIVLEQDTPLPRALSELTAQNAGSSLQILLGGDHADKLLVRSSIPPDGGIIQAQLEIRSGDLSRASSTPLIARPVLGQVAVFDAGGPDPRPGDRVTVRVGDDTISVEATDSMPAPQFLALIAQRLDRLNSDQARPDWTAQVLGASTPFRGRQLWLIPTDPGRQLSMPVVVTIARTDGSRFAEKFKNGPLPWKLMPVAGLAETVLTPPPLAQEVRHSLIVPKQSLCPGFHRFQCVAVATDGSRSTKTLDLVIEDPEHPVKTWAEIKRDVYEPSDELSVLLDPPENVANAHPVLFLDGRPVAIWDKDSPVVTLELKTPLVCPGRHEGWIEWQTSRQLPSPGRLEEPLARSLPFQFRVRRPLDDHLEWSPKKATAGEVKLTFSGAYLHNEIDVIVDGKASRLKRHPGKGDQWIADLGVMAPGEHTLLLRGRRELDKPTQLAHTLTITAPEETNGMQ